MYYLRSRYYNSEWLRFVNADILLNQNNSLLSENIFAYCANQVISYADTDGQAKTVVIYYWFPGCGAGFKEEVYNSPYFDASDSENVLLIPVDYKEDFIAAWNSTALDGVENLYLYVHGGAGYISFHDDETHRIDAGSDDFNLLMARQIDNVYLFSCYGAKSPSNGTSIASALTELTRAKQLFACDVGVSYRFDEDKILHIFEGENYYARAGGWDYYKGKHWYRYEYSKPRVQLRRNKLK